MSSISNYSCGTSKKLTYSYTNDTESDFSDVINVSNDNKIIIEKEYSSENYFYIYLDDYCEYSNIKFNYSKEKTTTDKEIDYYATLNGSNIELNELENELGKTKNRSQLNMIININKDIKINKISLSLIIEAIRANYSGFSSYLTPQSNAKITYFTFEKNLL